MASGGGEVAQHIDHERRRLVGHAAMAIAAAPLGLLLTARCARGAAADSQPKMTRELRALGGAAEWLNTSPLTTESLLGKVVLVDFCTYTCINWLRTLPYIRGWAAKYKSHGLTVIGVHTPEFTFEQNLANVRPAIAAMKLEHPIAIDNDYAIWRAFNNNYWPALYFIDARGRVRDSHFGEGEYEKSERTIQRLLTDAATASAAGAAGAAGSAGAATAGGAGASGAANIPRDLLTPDARGVEVQADWANLRSPENYLGYARTENFASRGGAEQDRRQTYAVPTRLALNQWALAGEWTMGKQGAVSNTANGRLACRFHARDLHLVMGPAQRGAKVRFRLTIDGQPLGPARGVDVDESGNGTVVEQRMYQLIRQPMPIADRLFQIEFLDAGAEIFAFTFG
jgi:thiol-disulfide isomerase/thioredoxin